MATAVSNFLTNPEPDGVSGKDDGLERNIAIQRLGKILYHVVKMWNLILNGFLQSVALMTSASRRC